MKLKYYYFSIFFILLSSCGMTDESDLIDNYENHKNEIQELKQYFNEIVPDNYLVRIRFDDSENIDFFVYEPSLDSTKRELLFQKWNIDLDNYTEKPQTEYDKKYHGKTNSFDTVKQRLKWNQETFDQLYTKLNNVNCIGISNRNPTEIEYDYRGMGVFSYFIFDKDLNEADINKYSDDCTSLFYKDNVVLAYGSGAIGSLCWPAFENK